MIIIFLKQINFQDEDRLHAYHSVYFLFQVTTLNLEIVIALARGSFTIIAIYIYSSCIRALGI